MRERPSLVAPSAAAAADAGAVALQPHGALLVVDGGLAVVQATRNADALLGTPPGGVLGRPLAALAPDLATQVSHAARTALLVRPTPIHCRAPGLPPLDVCVHRGSRGELLVELEPAVPPDAADGARLSRLLTAAVARVREATTLAALQEVAVAQFRLVTGYERVTLFRMTHDARGIATAVAGTPPARDSGGRRAARRTAPRLSTRAADRLARRRVCAVVDVAAPPTGLVGAADAPVPDLAIAQLRAPDRMQRRVLERGGARAGVFAPLVHEDRVWGLVVGEHPAPRACPPAVRLAAELLAEVVATRIAALETGVHARAAAHVRLLQRRLADATAATADWRPALLQDAPMLLRLLRADGLALFTEGAIHTAGHVPPDAVLRDVAARVARQEHDPVWACRSLAELSAAATTGGEHAAGVLSCALVPHDGEYLLWFRDARRTGRCAEWSAGDRTTAAAVRDAIVHIAVQVRAVGMLVAEQQAKLARDRVAALDAPVFVADAAGDVILTNEAFAHLVGRPHHLPRRLHDLASMFADAERARERLRTLTIAHVSWRDELPLRGPDAAPVAVRAEVIAGPHGQALGYVLTFADLRERYTADAAQQRLQGALELGGDAPLLAAVRANARDVADELAGDNAGAGDMIAEVERSLRRATDLGEQLLARAHPPYRGAD